MENKSVITNYVALQPPYRIIKHGLRMGIQIGIQRVTVAGGTPFRIETHDYPVVTAENRETALRRGGVFHADASSECEVWDNIETSQVSELCRLDDALGWMDFIRILWHDHSRLGDPGAKLQRHHIFSKLLKYFGSMQMCPPGQYTIRLLVETRDGKPEAVCSHHEDVLALNVPWTDDPDKMEKDMTADVLDYLNILSPCRRAKLWRITYETDDERLRTLVERLNRNDRATRFAKTVMGSNVVHAIIPYEEPAAQSPAEPEQPQLQPATQSPAAPELPPPAETRKRGRKKREFEDYLRPDAPKKLMSVLKEVMEGKTGRAAYATILSIEDKLTGEPDIYSVCRAFPSVKKSSYQDARSRHKGINRYLDRKNPIPPEEINNIREGINKKCNPIEQ